MIAVDSIDVLNPRERNAQAFEDIVLNIKKIGLKKPITVTPRPGAGGEERYALVCGEGRLKAFRSLGELYIPALVVNVCDEDAMIMGLTENIARRKYRTIELLSAIPRLRSAGYAARDIANKTGLSLGYVQGVLTLMSHGEERLLVGIEHGRISLRTALSICNAGKNDEAVQAALEEAYETGLLKGHSLVEARRIIERRRVSGPSLTHGSNHKKSVVTTSSLVRAYQKEAARQKLLVKKADLTQQRLLLIVSALRQLVADEHFLTLLRAERLDTMPQYLAQRVWPTASGP